MLRHRRGGGFTRVLHSPAGVGRAGPQSPARARRACASMSVRLRPRALADVKAVLFKILATPRP